MEQGVTAIIMTMLIVFVFIPAIYLGSLNSNRQRINEAMYLSTRVLEDCVLETEYTLEEIAQGYGYSEDPIMRIRIDEGKLFTEFDNVLFKNLGNVEEYAKVQSNILCKILVYPDRYVVWEDITGPNLTIYNYEDEFAELESGQKDIKVSAPKYFTYKKVNFRGSDTQIKLKNGTNLGYFYINTLNDKIRKMGNTDLWKNLDTYIYDFEGVEAGTKYDIKSNSMTQSGKLSTYDKNQVIIDTLNKEISYYTNGVKMDFINPASVRQQNIKTAKRDFNFFTGITFMVIYKEANIINVNSEMFNFNQYTVAGYTLEN